MLEEARRIGCTGWIVADSAAEVCRQRTPPTCNAVFEIPPQKGSPDSRATLGGSVKHTNCGRCVTVHVLETRHRPCQHPKSLLCALRVSAVGPTYPFNPRIELVIFVLYTHGCRQDGRQRF